MTKNTPLFIAVFMAVSAMSSAIGQDAEPTAETQIDPAIIQSIIEKNLPAVGHNVDIEKSAISKQIASFSAAYLERDVARIMDFFADDAYIVPVDGRIISGRDTIETFWTNAITNSAPMLALDMEPEELEVEGNIATDIGYYNGVSSMRSGKKSPFGGAYVTVWKKIDGVWRMQHSMWRAMPNVGEQ